MCPILSLPLAPRPTSLRVSYEQFLDLGDEFRHAEWVNGQVIMMAAVTDDHDAMTLFLSTIPFLFCEARGGGRVMREPFQMKTGPDLPGRSPDIFFVAAQNVGRIQQKNLQVRPTSSSRSSAPVAAESIAWTSFRSTSPAVSTSTSW